MHDVDGAMPGVVQRPDAYFLTFFRALIVTSDVALVVRINNVPVACIGYDKAAFAPAHHKPILCRNYTRVTPARDPDARVVLLRTINVIRVRVVGRDVIKLCGWLVALRRPGLPTIHRNTGAAVVGIADPIRVFRIDPEPVVVAMTRRQEGTRCCAVDRLERSR